MGADEEGFAVLEHAVLLHHPFILEHGTILSDLVLGTCVDHTAHLAVEESLDKAPEVKKATSKVRSFINLLKDSHILKEQFKQVMDEAGEDPLAIIQGTSNR